MSLFSIILTSVGLAMDAFAVSLTIGMSCENCRTMTNSLKAGSYFGFFQGAMPLIGYLVSIKFADIAGGWDGIISFAILAFIGGKMIYDAVTSKDDGNIKCYTNGAFLSLAVATSIDALAVGVSFAVMDVNILVATTFIAVITGILSFVGVKLGKFIAHFIGNKAEIAGGIILIFIGLKILFF